MKFGGTSINDADQVRKVIDLVRDRMDDRPVVVVSAHSGVTNTLDALAKAALDGPVSIEPVRERHADILADLGLPADLLDDLLDELDSLLTGITLVKELTDRSLDYIHSFGEQLSSRAIAAAFRKAGLPARALLAWDLGLVTDSAFGAAHPRKESYSRIARALSTVTDLPIVTGYIAKDRDGNITTLGRSGSDFTAAIIGAAVGAEEIQIWTDVEGVMSADPRIVPEATSIPQLSFHEASELAYYGARVIHPSTMVPAVEKGIPLRVLSTLEPGHPGTVILGVSEHGDSAVKSIAQKRGLTLINVVSTRMLLQHGFMARLFDVFARHEVVVDMIATSEISVSITTDSRRDLTPCLKELSDFAEVEIERGLGIICLVGEGIRTVPGVTARIFTTLSEAGVTTRMISVGATKINVSFLVDDANVEKSVIALHEAFFC
ncbi:MAG: aspartate kinase [Planctomycetota bacterium]